MKYVKEYSLLLLIFTILIIIMIIHYLRKDDTIKTININIVPTYISKLEDNSIWTPTLELIWNDLKNRVIGENIIFVNDKDNRLVKELNQETFKDNMLNKMYFYKNYGYMSNELRDNIINDLWEKFHEKSDILNEFNFNNNNHNYFLYSMLLKKFTFKMPFDNLTKTTFGINNNSNKNLDNNVKVLFYQDNNNYAVKLLTNELDEIILYKGIRKNSFQETYNYIDSKINVTDFLENDILKVGNLNFKCQKEYTELSNKKFYDINGIEFIIEKCLQDIQLNLDNTGGKVKSESGMYISKMSIIDGRNFNFTDDFMLFLKEKNKHNPYFGINIIDIKKFQ